MPLTIHSANGDHRFTVEVAATPQEQETGLMFRRSVAPNRGMIFPYDPPPWRRFWMKNTLMPLDIVFIGVDGTIVRDREREAAVARFDRRRRAMAVVLELRGGRAAELGISEGDRVSWQN